MSYISFQEGRGGEGRCIYKYSKVTFLNPFYSPDFNCAMCLRSAAILRVVLGVKEKVCGRSG